MITLLIEIITFLLEFFCISEGGIENIINKEENNLSDLSDLKVWLHSKNLEEMNKEIYDDNSENNFLKNFNNIYNN